MVETKTSSTASNQIQKKQQPFFNKGGEGSFFSKSNEATQSFFSPSTVQAKLTIGQPNDRYEVEADAMADRVVQRLSQPENTSITNTQSETIQRQCSECEEEEKLQKKEEPLAKDINSVQLKPIFESNEQQPEANIQTKPLVSSAIQTKCSHCEQEEQLQKKEEEEFSDNELSLQTKAMDMPSENSTNLESKLNSSKGGGSSLPSDLQTSMGSEFGADFSNVRIHTGTEAVQMSQDIGAQAFTHGSDIYFNEGKYDTNSNSGKHLLAHELTHTIQQGFSSANKSPNIQKNGGVCYPEDDLENEASTCELDYSQHEEIFILSGISLETEDLLEVAGYFPDGIQLNSSELFILVKGEGFANSIRVNGYRVNSSQSVNSGVNVFVFQIGKGRAIMVSSRVGGSIMLDAGSGTSQTSNSVRARQIARDVRNVLLSGLAPAPSRITISHVDLDHYNAVQEVLNLPEMRSADVRISRQQLMEAMRSGNWQTMNIQFNQQQNLIRINVAGARGVHIDRAYIGGMEVTEFRSVRAHQELTNTNRTTYNKNSTSEITVVRDFLTNTTHVFTGDGEGRTFSEIIDMVGSRAFQRIIGGGSRNLASVEFPHHGGSVTSGPNTRGMVRFLKLAFEASNGRVNFFAQTNQRFSSTDSASVNYLDVAEVPVQRVQEGSPNTTRVQRISGGTQEQITIDRGRITQILNAGNANASRVMDAQQTRHKLASLVELVEPVQRMLSLEGTRTEFRQLGEAASGVRTNIQNSQTSLNTSWNQFWQTMEAEAGSTGMRGSTPTQRIRQALNTLQTQVRDTNVQGLENDVTSIYNGLNIYQRLLTNALAMTLALNEGRIGDLQNLKVEQRRLLSRSISILGRAEVSRQVREAWRTIRRVWTGRMIRSVARRLGHYSAAHRHMMTDFRVVLNENIVNQARLNQLVEQARHGALPMSPGRTVPMRSRIGAGFMAAIEVLRIGLEFYETMEAAEDAEELRNIRGRAEGLQDINWWKHQGAHPSIELVERGSLYGWNIVSSHLSNNAKYEILNEEYSGEAPEFDKAVVTNVSDDDLSYVVGKMTVELITLNDWVSNYGHPESGSGVIKKFNNGWGVKLWNEEDGGYQYYLKTVIQEPLDALYDTLTQNLEEELEHEATDSDNRLATISNTAIFGTDRYIYVYDGSSLRRLDFEDRTPKFFVNGGHAPTNHELGEVRAADTYTYNILSQYNTISIQDGIPYNTFNIYRNSRGIGYVESDDIVYYMANNLGQTIRDMAVQRKALTNEALIQPKCNDCEEEETHIQPKSQDSVSWSNVSIERKLNASKGKGEKMDEGIQKEMNTAFNTSFDSINIHTDEDAVQMNKDLNAQAFTHGSDIYFNEGKYDTNSNSGKHLLAHELTHTVQQGASVQKEEVPEIQKQDSTEPSRERAKIILDALKGYTSGYSPGWWDSDSTTILKQFQSKSKVENEATISSLKSQASNYGSSSSAVIDWMFYDMTAEDGRTLRNLFIQQRITDINKIVAKAIYSLLSGWTSESNSGEIIGLFTQFTSSSLDNVLSHIETEAGYNMGNMISWLFSDLTTVHAERLRLHLFSVNGVKSTQYAAKFTASKIYNLLSGYTSISDSWSIVSNFKRTPEDKRNVVQYELDNLTNNDWGERLSADALMQDLLYSDYEELRQMSGMVLPVYRNESEWYVNLWEGFLTGLDFGTMIVQWTLCGILGIITGLISVIYDLIVMVIDIAKAVYYLAGAFVYLVSGGAAGSAEWLSIKDFFNGLAKLFSQPGKVVEKAWEEIQLEGSLIEGPLEACFEAEFWVRKFINFIVNIILIFVGGYGLAKGGASAVKTIVTVVRANGFRGGMRKLGAMVLEGTIVVVGAAGDDVMRVLRALRSPAESIKNAKAYLNNIRYAAADEGYWQFLRRQAGSAIENEKDFWREYKDSWNESARLQQEQALALEQRMTGVTDDIERGNLPRDLDTSIDDIERQTNALDSDVRNLHEEVTGSRELPGESPPRRANEPDQVPDNANSASESRRDLDPEQRRTNTEEPYPDRVRESAIEGIERVQSLPGNHQLKYTRNGKVYLCSPYCRDVTEFARMYQTEILDHDWIRRRLSEIADMDDEVRALQRLNELEDEVRMARGESFAVDDLYELDEIAVNREVYEQLRREGDLPEDYTFDDWMRDSQRLRHGEIQPGVDITDEILIGGRRKPTDGDWSQAPNWDKWVDPAQRGGRIIQHSDGSITYITRDGVWVKYNREGYPDFSNHLTHPDVKFVTFPEGESFHPRRTPDYERANQLAGRPEWGKEPPDGYRWHHHEDLETMQLVPEPIHTLFSHSGGVSLLD